MYFTPFTKKLVIIVYLYFVMVSVCFGQVDSETDRVKNSGRTVKNRQMNSREVIDREVITRKIYYRFGEVIDGVYTVGLQDQEYINAHIQIDTRYDLDIGKILGNISIGAGAIIITAITIPAIVPAIGPQIAVIVSQIVKASIAGAAIDAAIEGTIAYVKTGGNTDATIKHAIEGASEGFKWGAVIASGLK